MNSGEHIHTIPDSEAIETENEWVLES
jgi:hypothetical protein